jgi:hypothetical protein
MELDLETRRFRNVFNLSLNYWRASFPSLLSTSSLAVSSWAGTQNIIKIKKYNSQPEHREEERRERKESEMVEGREVNVGLASRKRVENIL